MFFPLRALATAYTYLFRGMPLIIVLYLLTLRRARPAAAGARRRVLVLGGAALVLTYGAYLAEVFRAGIESVHPSQRAAARSLGLTYRQTMRHVVLPQAVRRVAPPLLNDFVALQKDVGLISLAGPIDAIRAAQIQTAETFNFTPYVVAGVLFVLLAIPLIAVTDWVTLRAARRQSAEADRDDRCRCGCRGLRKAFARPRRAATGSTSTSPSTRWWRSSARPARASRRCCAASTCSRSVDDGTIHLDGEDITDPRVDPDRVRRRIGIVFQSYNLFPHLSVLDNVTLAPARGCTGARAAEAEAQAHGAARPGRAGRQGAASTRTGSPAASSSGSRSSGRWSTRPGCCCSTRSPRRWTRSWSARCWR